MADTLIVEPDANRGTIIFRAGWPTDADWQQSFRKLQILQEAS